MNPRFFWVSCRKCAHNNTAGLGDELEKQGVIFQRGCWEYFLLTVLCSDEIRHHISTTATAEEGKLNDKGREGIPTTYMYIYLMQLEEIQFAEIKVNIRAEIP